MRLFKIRTAIILVLFLGFHNNLNSQIKNQIIAKIGNEILTSYDVENKIKTNLFLAGEEINQGNIDKIKELTLQSLINLKLKINEIKKEFEKIVSIKDPKLLDVASKFEYWLKNYNHYGASHSESFRNFITNDKALVNYGVTYDEYKTLAEILKQKGMEIEYIIPEKAYNEQIERSLQMIKKLS